MLQVPNAKDEDDSIEIREVWNNNLEEEMILIEKAIDDFSYVAMDTEFPGVVCKTVTANPNPKHYKYNYETLKSNVNILKLIQLGLTLSDEQGNLPTCGTNKQCVWQFNFREFDLNSHMFANDSIEILCNSGIDLDKTKEYGIEAKHFGELLMSSGVVLSDSIHWVTFHCGYDFGYLLKLLTGKDVPEKESDFYILVEKFLMGFCDALYGGLESVAITLGVDRVGTSDMAGSDSLLTWRVFNQMKHVSYKGSIDKRYIGFLFGLDNHNCRTHK